MGVRRPDDQQRPQEENPRGQQWRRSEKGVLPYIRPARPGPHLEFQFQIFLEMLHDADQGYANDARGQKACTNDAEALTSTHPAATIPKKDAAKGMSWIQSPVCSSSNSSRGVNRNTRTARLQRIPRSLALTIVDSGMCLGVVIIPPGRDAKTAS